MRINSKLFSIVFVASTFPLISAGTAQASEMCTVKTAKQSVSSNTLCACDVVSSRMIKYIQRRADFESILEQTLLDCPAFASLLTDLPTASLGLADRRSGDGPDDENPRGGNEPDGERTSDDDDSPKGGDNPRGDNNPKGGDNPKGGEPKDSTNDTDPRDIQDILREKRQAASDLHAQADSYESKAQWHENKAEIRDQEQNPEGAAEQRSEAEKYRRLALEYRNSAREMSDGAQEMEEAHQRAEEFTR
ncbi:hypothetical protein K3740_08840 [Ruegeria conchae]|uniref:hypothetical protein n=1 Tax=Ruegeria conchae TaxID=981384 RepID=UPI0021A7358F|nr:hypothetical protein [Ruegeria conchae]UWR04766.1 hypothetical protein K3740_08840 [Ruegeria conchae]